MGKKVHVIDSPEFSEFVYNVMSNVPKQKIRELDPHEITIFKDDFSIRKFACTENLDRRILLLTKLGINICVVAAPLNEATEVLMAEVITQYKYVEKRQAITEAMAQNNMFVLASADIMAGIYMMAQNSHTALYCSNLSYAKLGVEMRKTKRGLHDEKLFESREGVKYAAKLILNTLSKVDDCPAVTNGLNMSQTMLLLAMLPYRETFISIEGIQILMNRSDREKGTAKQLGVLEKKGMLLRMPGYGDQRNKENKYTLTAEGFNNAMLWIKHIMFGI